MARPHWPKLIRLIQLSGLTTSRWEKGEGRREFKGAGVVKLVHYPSIFLPRIGSVHYCMVSVSLKTSAFLTTSYQPSWFNVSDANVPRNRELAGYMAAMYTFSCILVLSCSSTKPITHTRSLLLAPTGIFLSPDYANLIVGVLWRMTERHHVKVKELYGWPPPP